MKIDKNILQEKFLSLLSQELYIQINSVISATVYIAAVKEVRFNLNEKEGMNTVILYYGDFLFDFAIDDIESITETDKYLEEDEEFSEGFEFVFCVNYDEGTLIHIYRNTYDYNEEDEQ